MRRRPWQRGVAYGMQQAVRHARPRTGRWFRQARGGHHARAPWINIRAPSQASVTGAACVRTAGIPLPAISSNSLGFLVEISYACENAPQFSSPPSIGHYGVQDIRSFFGAKPKKAGDKAVKPAEKAAAKPQEKVLTDITICFACI